jgi:hypothetical protein
MLGHTRDEREGALLRRLKDVGHGGRAGRFGFVTGTEGARRRPMVVVARVASGPDLAREMSALVEAGAEAVEIVARVGMGGIVQAIRAAGVPCGLYFTADSGDAATAIADTEGLDWIHVDSSAPARHLAGKGPTRLVTVTPDLPPGRLGGLADLHADVLVVDGMGRRERFSVDDLMAIGTIEAATKRPALAADGLGLTPEDVAVLHEHGMEGLLLTGGAAAVRAFVAAIDALALGDRR